MKKWLNDFIDNCRKEKIFELAAQSGCDIDGDMIHYKNVRYYVNIADDVLERAYTPSRLFRCNPNKHQTCNKSHCYIYGSYCKHTTVREYRMKWYEMLFWRDKDE